MTRAKFTIRKFTNKRTGFVYLYSDGYPHGIHGVLAAMIVRGCFAAYSAEEFHQRLTSTGDFAMGGKPVRNMGRGEFSDWEYVIYRSCGEWWVDIYRGMKEYADGPFDCGPLSALATKYKNATEVQGCPYDD